MPASSCCAWKTRWTRRDYGARSRALVAQGGKPMHRAVMLIHGGVAAAAMANSSRATAEGRVLPIEVLSRKPGADQRAKE
jgi:hypothetical protein